MSYSPFETETQIHDSYGDGIEKVSVRPLQLMSEGWQLIGHQYWLMLGILLTAIFLSAIVPFGILFGPLTVGTYLCLIDLENGKVLQFNRLFEGFDRFMESLIALILIVAITFLFNALVVGVWLVILFGVLAGAPEAMPLFVAVLLGGILLMTLVSPFIYMPFLFCYQLIADRGVDGLESVKLSCIGVWRNLFGIMWFSIVMSIIYALSLVFCGLPMLFLMPVFFAAFFRLYRQIYGIPMASAV